jgi:2-C-methyl-D-erythritol 4-phosphate cytidylyltransferase
VGRRKVSQIRAIAVGQNWLDAARPIPDDALIAAHYKASAKAQSADTAKPLQNTSTVEPYREDVLTWYQQGIPVSTMCQALARKHG